jgi:flavin reductase (DIM6/NTAB) family NADH-FMN oxidoreductase RutF
MAKITLGPQTLLYPMPAFLIGATVEGRPNFMTAAWCGIVCSEPPMASVAVRPHRHTFRGIKESGTFSINVPSASLVRETDFCGIVSGTEEDKTAACGFSVFYGKLENAPMVEECPVNLECRVHGAIDLGSHTLFIGRIEEVHVSEEYLTDGRPDIAKIEPIVYGSGTKKAYYKVGPFLAHAFRVGLELRR